ncbi:uncharacterized protein LOC143280168 [Babylonia areolata]|uniref:uncharacterized protein LOC143280168 n=1 Tax=Babylonia areolata TaxID=304850 RepID=UPI003FCFD13D
MCMIKYYHYTDKEGLRGILRSREIRMSTGGLYGPGVYFCRMSPKNGRAKISFNNWDGVANRVESLGRVDYAIAVKLPDHKMKTVANGTIHVFTEDVDLDFTTYWLYSKYGDHRDLEVGHTDDEESDGEDADAKSCSLM